MWNLQIIGCFYAVDRAEPLKIALLKIGTECLEDRAEPLKSAML